MLDGNQFTNIVLNLTSKMLRYILFIIAIYLVETVVVDQVGLKDYKNFIKQIRKILYPTKTLN